MSNTSSRREFLTHGAAAGGACLLPFLLAGCETRMTPSEARAAQVPFRTLTAAEVQALDALGETVLPGSAAAGLAHFIDHQLSGKPDDSMLMIKYLGVAAPFAEFYRGGLQAIDAAAVAIHGKTFAELDAQQSADLVRRMSATQLQGWQGPPPALFYFVIRNDAVDVVYGTQSGFDQLGVPYLAHIAPPTPWGQ